MDSESYGFLVEWYDKQADLVRNYALTAFSKKGKGGIELQMFDSKTKRMFLKRTAFPDLTLNDLRISSTIMVFGRQLKIVEYANKRTREMLESKRTSFGLITAPGAFRSFGAVVSCVERAGLTISRLRLVDDGGAPVVAMKVVGENADDNWADAVAALPSGTVSKVSADAVGPYFGAPSTAAFDNCTLAIIRPHAVKSGNVGAIVSSIMESGFEISAAKLVQLKRAEALELLEVYKGVFPYFSSLVDSMIEGPCIALELRAEGVVEKFRDLCGPHDVEMARHIRPQSLRAKFGISNDKNGVHATDLERDAELEVRYMFEILN